MLEFLDVNKSFWTDGRLKPILMNATFEVTVGENFGVIIPPQSGRSTLEGLIAGGVTPDSGRITRRGKISWSLGSIKGVIPTLSGRENARYIAKIYGVDADEMLAFCIDILRIGRYIDMPVNTYSNTLKRRLSVAIAAAIEFDMYLTGVKIGQGLDKEFKERIGPVLEKRFSETTLILMGTEPKELEKYCRRGILIRDAEVYSFESIEEAHRVWDYQLAA